MLSDLGDVLTDRVGDSGRCRKWRAELIDDGTIVADSDDHKLTDASFYAHGDPHAIFAKLRADDPVHWTEGTLSRGFWSLTRFSDVKTMLMNDTRVFSLQTFGAALPTNAMLEDPETSTYLKLLRTGASLSVMDGQPHSELRRILQVPFTVPSIASIEEMARQCMRDILARVLDRGECDFTVEVAGMLPLMVIAKLMEIPEEDADTLYRYNNMMAAPEDPEWSEGDALSTSLAGTNGLMEYLTALAHERRRGDGKDLMSMLAHARIDGELLDDAKLGFNGITFFAAGHETTRAALSAGLAELLKDDSKMQLLRSFRDDPASLGVAAEEFVRWTSPLTHALRTATEDFRFNDTLVKKGDWVVAWFPSANRDERAFADPDVFDIRRSPNNHLGFATGKHFCLGAHLARLEMRIVLEAVIDNMKSIELAGPVEMAASNHFWGIKHLPIRFKRRPS